MRVQKSASNKSYKYNSGRGRGTSWRGGSRHNTGRARLQHQRTYTSRVKRKCGKEGNRRKGAWGKGEIQENTTDNAEASKDVETEHNSAEDKQEIKDL